MIERQGPTVRLRILDITTMFSGAFNSEVYGDLLDLSDDELQRLRDSGVIRGKSL